MRIQLNAAPENAPATSSSVSNAVSMSQLLFEDVDTSREPVDNLSGSSSLMNPPDVGFDQESESPALKLPTLQTPELQTLQQQLYTALEKLSNESAPVVKRQKKSKQTRRAKPASDNSADVHKALEQLHHSITASATQNVLEDVVTITLRFLELLNEKESIQSLVVEESENSVNVAATLATVSQQPLYGQSISAIQHAVLCMGEQGEKKLLKLVSTWALARPKPENWTWILPALASLDSYLVQEFLTRRVIAKPQDVKGLLPGLEYLAKQNSAQMVDIMREILEECVQIDAEQALWTVQRLATIAADSAVIVKVCDDSLHLIVTEELVMALARKFEDAKGCNTSVKGNELNEVLLKVFCQRSNELLNSGFQLLLLLQKLMAVETSSQFATSVAWFQSQVIQFARSNLPKAFIQGIYRYLPYICQTTLRSFSVETSDDKFSDVSMTDDEHILKNASSRCFEEWREWLILLAQYISRKEVTEQLIKAELLRAEFEKNPPMYQFNRIHEADRALCELLTTLLTPASPEYVAFMRNIMQEGKSSGIRAQRRILEIVQTLMTLNGTNDQSSAEIELPILLQDHNTSCIQQFARAKSWRSSLDAFSVWKGVVGLEFYETFLDFALSKDSIVASRAISLLSQTPFLSLEDPKWQYRCVRKLSRVFFSLLRHYRVFLVQEKDESLSEVITLKSDLQSRLHTLKMVLFRVLALDGGVAHYPSSVHSMFASLWLDALLSTTSATSVPTHFPNRVNFADLNTNDEDGLDERQILRCERTISSKCTNLQSSQVITKNSNAKLAYRKTLDSSWEREMRAARVCSIYATDLFAQLVVSTGTAANLMPDVPLQAKMVPCTDRDAQLERRLTIVVDMLLDRVIPCCGIPSDDVYKDVLPNRSTFDNDLRIEQWLNHFPVFLPLLRTIVSSSTVLGSSQSLRLVPVLKSALVVLLGHWNSVKCDLSVDNLDVPPYMRNANQLTLTCELMRLLRATNWLPTPLSKTAELLPLTTPADIRSILFSCWFFLSDHPPRLGSCAPTPATSATASPISSGSSPAGFSITDLPAGGTSSRSSHPPLEFYLIPVRKALHRNIHRIGAKYPLFMC